MCQAANRATSSQPQLAKTVALDAEKADDQEIEKKPTRRRRSRGGRRNKSTGTDQVSETAATEPGQAGSENVSAPSEGSINEKTDNDVPDAELKSEPDISEPSSPAPPVDETAIASEVVASDAGETPQPANDADQTSKDKDEGQTATTAVVFDADKPLASEPVLVSDENGDEKEAKPKRRGWWSRGK